MSLRWRGNSTLGVGVCYLLFGEPLTMQREMLAENKGSDYTLLLLYISYPDDALQRLTGQRYAILAQT